MLVFRDGALKEKKSIKSLPLRDCPVLQYKGKPRSLEYIA